MADVESPKAQESLAKKVSEKQNKKAKTNREGTAKDRQRSESDNKKTTKKTVPKVNDTSKKVGNKDF